MSWEAGSISAVTTLLFSFAHPDDESFSGAGTAMRAKAAGAKFTFGTNNAGKDDLGVPTYCLEMIEECRLTPSDLFVPSPDKPKAIQRKRLPK